MDKRLYILGGILVLAGLVYVSQKPSCKEASDKDYQMAQVVCYNNLDKVETKKELCLSYCSKQMTVNCTPKKMEQLLKLSFLRRLSPVHSNCCKVKVFVKKRVNNELRRFVI